MRVEFDPAKDRINIRKHKISLARASELDLTTASFTQDTRKDYGEERWIAVGFIDTRLYVLIYTPLGEDAIQAISLRKAEPQERTFYAQA